MQLTAVLGKIMLRLCDDILFPNKPHSVALGDNPFLNQLFVWGLYTFSVYFEEGLDIHICCYQQTQQIFECFSSSGNNNHDDDDDSNK